MKAFFEAIQYVFVKILFFPMDMLRRLELENWWVANFITWIFIIICCIAVGYWLKQLKIFKDNNSDAGDHTTSHSFLS
ncbi:MAG: uracil phosphoribosyltransferase [Flavobacterium sp.]|nr:MAG: uracil phosphoribosyltransferase [Flavobacterium sp.]